MQIAWVNASGKRQSIARALYAPMDAPARSNVSSPIPICARQGRASGLPNLHDTPRSLHPSDTVDARSVALDNELGVPSAITFAVERLQTRAPCLHLRRCAEFIPNATSRRRVARTESRAASGREQRSWQRRRADSNCRIEVSIDWYSRWCRAATDSVDRRSRPADS